MKLGDLKAIGHNISDSLASGIGLMIGVYTMDIYAEAAAADPGYIEVDFLAGTTSGALVSHQLQGAIDLYREALPRLCERHGVDIREIQTLSTRFGTDPVRGPHFSVLVETTDGRSSSDLYVGTPGKRPRHMKR